MLQQCFKMEKISVIGQKPGLLKRRDKIKNQNISKELEIKETLDEGIVKRKLQ